MPVPKKYKADFVENNIYHIYNRTNNLEKLFRSDADRHLFMKKYNDFLSPILDTYSWCLLPNHFHFLARLKSILSIKENIEKLIPGNRTKTEKLFLKEELTLDELTEQSFKRFFQSYTQSINTIHNRNGNLFCKSFKRIAIDSDDYFTQALIYTHANPVKHNIVKDFTNYKWSSWQTLLSSSPTLLLREELMDWFGHQHNFIKTHREMTTYYYETAVSIEE